MLLPAHAPPAAGIAPDRPSWTHQVPLLALVMAGVALRVAAARGDLWLDEIWSAEIARQIGSVGEVFTRLHHDNNHHLNTLWLMLVGDEPPILVRGLALASGAATLAVMALATARRRLAVALVASTLASACHLLVHYQSEARGYAPALLCAVVSYAALERYLGTRRPGWAILLAAAAALGILSHLTFAFVLAGSLAWAGLDAWRRRKLDVVLLAAFGVPLAALTGLWAVDLRHLVRGGGPEEATWGVLRELWRITFNLPAGALELLGLPLIVLVAWQLVRLWRAGDARWIFFMATFGAALGPVLLRSRADYLAARYFAVCVPFLLMLVAEVLGALAATSRAGRVAAVAALALFVVGAVAPVGRLVADGRGRYREAIRYLERHSASDPVTIGTDHEFRNGMVLGFHAGRMALEKRLLLLTERAGAPPPEWYIRHEFDPAPAAAQGLLGPGDAPYRLAAVFPYAGLSGWTWLLYHRVDAPGAPRP